MERHELVVHKMDKTMVYINAKELIRHYVKIPNICTKPERNNPETS